MRQKWTIGISGINAVDNPGPGVGIARALKEDPKLDLNIVGLAYDAMEPGIYLDWLIDKTYILPYPSCSKDTMLKRLAYIKQAYGLDFIFPNLDAELPFYAKYRQEIESLGIKLFVPEPLHLEMRKKQTLPVLAKKLGVQSPATVVINSWNELNQAIGNTAYPIMMKGAMYKAYRVGNRSHAVEIAEKLIAEWGFPILLQQIIDGVEMNVIGVGDGSGDSLGAVGIKKMWITELGKIWTGVTVKHEKMLALASNFIQSVQWRGPFELECIVSGDEIYLIEINPRFPAWSYFATGVGINLPAETVRRAFNIPLSEKSDYSPGKLYIRYTYETIQDMSMFQKITLEGEN